MLVEVMNLYLGLKLGLVKILKLKYFEAADVWLRFWSWCLVDILRMKFDQGLRKNLRYGNGFVQIRNVHFPWTLYIY